MVMLKTTGTRAFTMSQRPSRFSWTGYPHGNGYDFTLVRTRKPRLRYWRELMRYYLGLDRHVRVG